MKQLHSRKTNVTCTELLEDTKLILAKLSTCDMVALDAKCPHKVLSEVIQQPCEESEGWKDPEH